MPAYMYIYSSLPQSVFTQMVAYLHTALYFSFNSIFGDDFSIVDLPNILFNDCLGIIL